MATGWPSWETLLKYCHRSYLETAEALFFPQDGQDGHPSSPPGLSAPAKCETKNVAMVNSKKREIAGRDCARREGEKGPCPPEPDTRPPEATNPATILAWLAVVKQRRSVGRW